ncbi:hypothetical protein [Nonomuraea endophytica]|uniref:hypothetical protein n=1 Tax=Nonomuraea endophytica TaxID=714136 RepID=UPI0037CC3C21
MELSEYARRNRRIVIPLLAVPLIAGLSGAGWALTQPAEYTHSSEVQVPTGAGQNGAAAVEQTISTFRTLAGSATVIDRVAKETGVGADALRERLTTGRPVSGGQRGVLVRVHFTGPDPAQVVAVTRSATAATTETLLGQALTQARQSATSAGKTAEQARDALADGVKRFGGLPAERYRTLLGEMTRLETELVAPVSKRSDKDVRKAIKTLRGRIEAAAPQVLEYQALQDAAVQSARKATEAGQRSGEVAASLSAANAAITPVTPEAQPLSRGALILRASGLSGGVGLALAVLIVVLRRPGGRRVTVPEAVSPPPVPVP